MPARRDPGRRRLRLPPPRSVVLVGAGGALGALARFAVSRAIGAGNGTWPWDTLLVNVSGAFLLAVMLGLITARFDGGAWARPLLGTGLLGAYTTFSTLSVEIERLAVSGATGTARAYAVITLVTGVMAAWAGTVVAVALPELRRRRHAR